MAATAPKDVFSLSPEDLAYTNGPVLLAVTGAFYAVALLTVVLRGYSRRFIVNSFGKDDWAIIVALVCATVCFASYARQVSLGVGRYVAVIQANEDAYREILKARQVHMIAAVVGISVVKVSVAFFLLRLAIRRLYSYFLWSVIAFTGCFMVACAGSLIFQCLPVQAAWDTRLQPPPFGTGDARCFSPQTFRQLGLFNGIINIITDFILALLPIPLIWTLRISTRSRFSLTLVLGLGMFAAVASIIRQASASSTFTDAEPWVRDKYAIWNFIELDVGIISASLPAAKPLLSRCFDAANNPSMAIRSADVNGADGVLQHNRVRDNGDIHMAIRRQAPPRRVMRRHSLSISHAETLYNPRASMNGDFDLLELDRKGKREPAVMEDGKVYER